jgi:DNA-binding MarR family transcriptional regulator
MTDNTRTEDITYIQYKIMEYLYFNDRKNLSQVSKCIYLSMPNASREVKKLSEKKIIKKDYDKEDKRKHYLSLTEYGKSVMNNSFGKVVKNFEKKIGDLSIKEQDELIKNIEIIIKKMLF